VRARQSALLTVGVAQVGERENEMRTMFKSMDKTVADNRKLDLEFEMMLRGRKDYSDFVGLDDYSPRGEWEGDVDGVGKEDAAGKTLTEADWSGMRLTCTTSRM
jgi:hypothetical protein